MYPSGEGWAYASNSECTTLLNDFHSDQAGTDALPSFRQFSHLPLELILLVWKHVLQRHRLISISIIDKAHQPPWEDIEIHDITRNSLGNIISGTNYRIQITTHHLLTPLLCVSRESRQAALDFYRVHIPYDRKRYGEGRCIYFNPEFDFLHVRPKGTPEILADFVHDFKAYDPRGAGIFNIGIGGGTPHELELPMDYGASFFHNVVRIGSCLDSRTMFQSLNMKEVRFNRSYPINAATEAFDLVETDPRPIDTDLDKVAIGYDPRHMPCLWQQMERRFGITRKQGSTDYRYHIAASLYGWSSMVTSRASAMQALNHESDLWRLNWEKGTFWELDYVNPDTPEKLKSVPIPAFGFWILPLGAFGEVPEADFSNVKWRMQTVVSLEKHRLALGVFHLPREG